MWLTPQDVYKRQLLRRAARHGKKLGIEGKFMAELSKTVIALSKDGYPELEEKSAMIFKVLSEEEDKFNKTIDQGLAILADIDVYKRQVLWQCWKLRI